MLYLGHEIHTIGQTAKLQRIWQWIPREVVLPEKLGGGVWLTSQNPYPIYDQNLWFSLPYLRPDQKFDTLFMTLTVGTVVLDTIYKGLLSMILSIMMKK